MLPLPTLKPGDKIAIVAPARWPAPAYVDALVATLTQHGLVPVVHPQVNAYETTPGGQRAQLAGSDAVRAAALNEVLADPTIQGVFFPRGGTGTYRILDLIDTTAAAKAPKVVVGYSDLDILLDFLAQRCGYATYRGPMGVNFATPTMDPQTEADCFDVLMRGKRTWRWQGTVITPGTAEGRLVGGNLAVMNTNIGTPYQMDATDAVLVLEECDELLFRLDRFLYQAAAAGLFTKARAVLFGTIENMLDGEQHDGSGTPFGHEVPDMLRHYVPAHVPMAYGLPLGHGAHLSTHPIGARVRVTLGEDVRMEREELKI